MVTLGSQLDDVQLLIVIGGCSLQEITTEIVLRLQKSYTMVVPLKTDNVINTMVRYKCSLLSLHNYYPFQELLCFSFNSFIKLGDFD